MPTEFRKADAKTEVAEQLAAAIKRWHPDLVEAGVNVGVVLAYNADGPAVKHGGYPATATMKVCSAKDRATKGYDAELTIDETAWNNFEPARRMALLDHECSHIAPKPRKKKKGEDEDDEQKWQFHNDGRPKLSSVKGDWNVGDGFEHVVARHGLNAIEYHNIDHAKKLADAARKRGEKEKTAS